MAAPCPIAENTVSLALTGLVCAYHAKLFSVSHPNLLCMLWFLLALLLSGFEWYQNLSFNGCV